MTQPGELPPDRTIASVSPWTPWLSGLASGVGWLALNLVFDRGGSLITQLLIAAGIALLVAGADEFARRWRKSGRGSFRGLRIALFVCVLAAAFAVQDRRQGGLDYDVFCREATNRALTPGDLMGMQRRIEGELARAGNHNPEGEEVAKFRAAVQLWEEAKEVVAPYQLPLELRGNLPPVPDTARVRALQSELAVACR